MAILQKGVLEKSDMFFCTTPGARDFYLQLLSVGHFYCNSEYYIERYMFDSILIMYVVSGSFHYRDSNGVGVAGAGTLALVDCFERHSYSTSDDFEGYWCHITGGESRAMAAEIRQTKGDSVSGFEQELIAAIYRKIKKREQTNAVLMSGELYSLFIKLLAPVENLPKNDFSEILEYLEHHFGESITIETLANRMTLSPSAFAHMFKSRTGVSPYTYLMEVRLSHAKEMLKNTTLPINEIAGKCGFLSDSNFICFFRKSTGLSPLKFRKAKY